MSTKSWKLSTLVNFMAGYLYGMTLSNNVSDATNDIDIAAGKCVDSTGARVLNGGALTKQLDATWAAGNNAGGRMSAAGIANTTYHVFAILKDSDGSVDYGFDTSPTAPTMPSGYTYFRRIGSIVRAGGTILAFIQTGDRFQLKVPVQDVNAAQNPGTSAVTPTLSVPSGIPVVAEISVEVIDATPASVTGLLVTSTAQTDTAATSLWNGQIRQAGAAVPQALNMNFAVPTSNAQIRYRLSDSTTDHYVYVMTTGWTDTRGRLAA